MAFADHLKPKMVRKNLGAMYRHSDLESGEVPIVRGREDMAPEAVLKTLPASGDLYAAVVRVDTKNNRIEFARNRITPETLEAELSGPFPSVKIAKETGVKTNHFVTLDPQEFAAFTTTYQRFEASLPGDMF